MDQLAQALERAPAPAVYWHCGRDALIRAFGDSLERGGPLAGVPYGLKDLFDLAGVPTTAGSSFLPEVRSTPKQDSAMARFLRARGAIPVAKTGTVEFAYGLSGENRWFGDCPHPRLPGVLAGGSSSGSAWLVGAGITPFAIGTDTAGSMRAPAAYCGIFSWRDGPGSLVQDGCIPLAASFDTPGWFARTPRDLILLNEVFLEEGEAEDPPRILDLAALSPTLDPALRAAGDRLLRALGAATDPGAAREASEAFADSAEAYNVLGSCEAYAYHARWLDRYRERYDPVIWARIDRARHWREEDLARAKAREAAVQEALRALLAQYDALAIPVTPQPSPDKRDLTEACRQELLNLTGPATLGRNPVLTVPLPLEDGRSGGLQFVFACDERRGALARRLLEQLSLATQSVAGLFFPTRR